VIVRGWEQVYLRGVGLLHDIPDLERIVLTARDGAPVYLRDVAEVVVGAEPRQGAVTRDGPGEVVAGMVIMLKGENSRDVVDRVKKAVDEMTGDAARGRAPERVLRPHLADRGLPPHGDPRAARGRPAGRAGAVPVRGRAAHGAHGRLLAAAHLPDHASSSWARWGSPPT
jgi:hypothetical protein